MIAIADDVCGGGLQSRHAGNTHDPRNRMSRIMWQPAAHPRTKRTYTVTEEIATLTDNSTEWLSAMLHQIGRVDTDEAARRAWLVLKRDIETPQTFLDFLMPIAEVVALAEADAALSESQREAARTILERLDLTVPLLRNATH